MALRSVACSPHLESKRVDFLKRRLAGADDRKRDPVITEENFHSAASAIAVHMSASSGATPPKLITYTLWGNSRMVGLPLLPAYAPGFFDGNASAAIRTFRRRPRSSQWERAFDGRMNRLGRIQ